MNCGTAGAIMPGMNTSHHHRLILLSLVLTVVGTAAAQDARRDFSRDRAAAGPNYQGIVQQGPHSLPNPYSPATRCNMTREALLSGYRPVPVNPSAVLAEAAERERIARQTDYAQSRLGTARRGRRGQAAK